MSDPDSLSTFARKVRDMRKRQGLSQDELAARVGATTDTISNIERQSSSTKPQTAAKLATALGVELWELFHLEAPPDMSPDAVERREAVAELMALVEQLDAQQIRALTSMAKGVLGLQRD